MLRLKEGQQPPQAEGACWAKDTTPAVIETTTEQIVVTDEQRDAAGTVTTPATYQTKTHQRLLQDHEEVWFRAPCPQDMTVNFVATLQRALKARGLYMRAGHRRDGRHHLRGDPPLSGRTRPRQPGAVAFRRQGTWHHRNGCIQPMTLSAAQSRYEAEVTRQWSAHPADGAHDLGHLRRVWTRAQLIAMDEPCDLDILLAACMFHDLVNLPKSHPERARASTLSAEAACHFLRADGFPEDKLSAVGHAIAAHSFSAGITPMTTEARVLQDADRLEALGAIGIARMFHVSGAMGGGLFRRR